MAAADISRFKIVSIRVFLWLSLLLILLILLVGPFMDGLMFAISGTQLYCLVTDNFVFEKLAEECRTWDLSPHNYHTFSFFFFLFGNIVCILLIGSLLGIGVAFSSLKDKQIYYLSRALCLGSLMFCYARSYAPFFMNAYQDNIFDGIFKPTQVENQAYDDMVGRTIPVPVYLLSPLVFFFNPTLNALLYPVVFAITYLVCKRVLAVRIKRAIREPETLSEQLLKKEGESRSGRTTTQDILSKYAVDVIQSDQIDLKERIGAGAFGEVFVGIYKGTKVAVKRLKHSVCASEEEEEETTRQILQEISVWRLLRHPNIVQFMGACVDHNQMFIVSESLENKSLKHAFKSSLPWPTKLKIAKDVALGMTYLHSHSPPILHRDLKSENILLTRNFDAKIADFGLSKICETENKTQTMAGTFAFMAPEVLRGDKYGSKADVYSFAIVCWEILTERQPFADVNSHFQVLNGIRPEIPSELQTRASLTLSTYQSERSEQEIREHSQKVMFVQLIERCWAQEPENRPLFFEIFNSLTAIEQLSDVMCSEEGASSSVVE